MRIHDGAEAADLNESLNARAFTYGRQIFFGAGQYQPDTPSGQRLLAHELTHVVQQSGTSTLLQRQLVTPLSPGGGYGGLMDRDRRRSEDESPPEETPSGGCNVQLCYLPLDALRQFFIDRGLDPDRASQYSYLAANHVFIRWDGKSAGFTRLPGESKSDAQVHGPPGGEPRAGERYQTCVNAELRTVPLPTIGQMVSFTPLGAIRDIASYAGDVVHGLRHCRNTNCDEATSRIESVLRDPRAGLYDLYDENCETWARNVLRAACLQAPEISGRGGGIGNIFQRVLRETPFGDAYHALRLLFGGTRPMPEPEQE